eukprot:2415968-Rhodomonas_salina.1
MAYVSGTSIQQLSAPICTSIAHFPVPAYSVSGTELLVLPGTDMRIGSGTDVRVGGSQSVPGCYGATHTKPLTPRYVAHVPLYHIRRLSTGHRIAAA